MFFSFYFGLYAFSFFSWHIFSVIQCYCTVSSGRIFSKYSYLLQKYKETMFLNIVSVFHLFSGIGNCSQVWFSNSGD